MRPNNKNFNHADSSNNDNNMNSEKRFGASSSLDGYAIFFVFCFAFVAGGIFTLYKAFTALPDKRSVKDIVLGFVGITIGIGIYRSVNWIKGQIKKNEESKALYHHEPWKGRHDWAKGYSVANEAARQKFNFYVGLIVFLVTSGVSALVIKKIVEENGPLILLTIFIFPLVGLIMIREAFYEFINRKKFGEAHFVFEGTGGVLGGNLKGQIRFLNRTFGETPVSLRLQCKSVIARKNADNDDWQTAHILWQKKEKQILTPTGRTAILPINLTIPFDLDATDESDSNNRKIWEMIVEFKTEGVDLKRTYEIPVFKTNESDPTKTQTSEASEALRDLKIQKPKSFPIFETKDGLELVFSRKQVRRVSFLLCMVGFVFLCSGVYFINSVLHAEGTSYTKIVHYFNILFQYIIPGLFGFLFSAVGLLVLCLGFYSSFERVKLFFGNDQLILKRKLGPFNFHKKLFYKDIRAVYLKVDATVGDTMWYDISLDVGTKFPVTIASALQDKNEALWVLGHIEGRKASFRNTSS